MGRQRLSHLPVAFCSGRVGAGEEGNPRQCPCSGCLIWTGDCPSWEMLGPWEVVWMKGLVNILEVTEAYKIYPLPFPL